ncbi:hypothetical protein IKJ53_07790 [bacterium]|nr:hypothetical protein [bacterium]
MSLWTKMTNLSPTAKIASSLILKDAVGCYLYVSQARKNKEMTPQQRADVANYDLANGVINIGLQLVAVKPIEQLMKKFVEKNWVKHFFTNMADKVKPENNYKDIMKFLKDKKGIVEGSVALLSVLICQYFIKRVVSPFLSVPAGEKSKQIGLIKPKLYEGETFDKKRDFSIFHNEDIKKLYDKVMGNNDEKENK